MASVTFSGMWVNLAADPSQYLRLSHANWSEQDNLNGEVRQYASGRLRTVLHDGDTGSQKFTFLTDDLTVVNQLKAWKGQTVLLRDHRGRSSYGTCLTVSSEDIGPLLTQVSVGFDRVSFDPSV